MANYHSQQTLAAKYGLRVTACDWRVGVDCVFHDCKHCGWFPEVEERRKEALREKLKPRQTYRIGHGSIDPDIKKTS